MTPVVPDKVNPAGSFPEVMLQV
jgi:hypothetical protein